MPIEVAFPGRLCPYGIRRIFLVKVAMLPSADLQATLDFVREAEAATGPDAFPTALLDRLRELVPSDTVGYCEQDRARGCQLYYEGCARARELAAATSPLDMERVWWLLTNQSPIVIHHEDTGDFGPVKLTDFLTRRELHRLELHRDLFRPLGIEHRLVVGLPASRAHTKCFLFDRGGNRDFDERDRLVLELLQPHLAACYTAARDRRLAAALTLGENVSGALLVLSPSNRIDFADPNAERLLTRYFERESSGRLPDEIEAWLKCRSRRFDTAGSLPSPDLPLTVDRNGSRLLVRRVGHLLLLKEEDALLTKREREIVDLVAEGRTNGEIAVVLTVAPATVRKHLENIYVKLGVHTRTAAAARARN
jgi:DNA-binding CsgD family transcriptional regulator